jgi:GNAT superfamily N-acetyltransferase
MKYELPAGVFLIRLADASDKASIAAPHVATFNETHGPGPRNPSLELRESQWKRAFESEGGKDWFCLVIENELRNLVGFAKGIPYRLNDLPYKGELNKIYLLKKYQGIGLGKLLLKEISEQFLNRNISSMLSFGDANNPSNKFYEAMGATKLYSKNGEFHGGYGWKDLRSVLNSPG